MAGLNISIVCVSVAIHFWISALIQCESCLCGGYICICLGCVVCISRTCDTDVTTVPIWMQSQSLAFIIQRGGRIGISSPGIGIPLRKGITINMCVWMIGVLFCSSVYTSSVMSLGRGGEHSLKIVLCLYHRCVFVFCHNVVASRLKS